ncbi:MAG: cupredoxin domain-containing protein [ANME-2 cluster archaeon]|nr:cupredoxin domain-containing protein [ANME-2 cluster archaeon]
MKHTVLLMLILVSMITITGCTYTNIPEPTQMATEMPTAKPTATPTISATSTPASTPRDGPAKVTIEGNSFVPDTVTISIKDAVQWTNMDSTPHKITIMGMVTDDLGEGDSFVLSFYQKKTYEYSCKYHPYMKGTVIVQ